MKTGNNLENNIELNVGQKKRLDYLLKQAEIFTHFVKNGAKAKQNEQRGKDKTLVKAVDESVKKSVYSQFLKISSNNLQVEIYSNLISVKLDEQKPRKKHHQLTKSKCTNTIKLRTSLLVKCMIIKFVV